MKKDDTELLTHKYAIQFDISPEISYLDHDRVVVIADLLPLFRGFPEGVWISQQSVDEGLDFCRVILWVFSESADAIKSFSIWFQALFRNTHLAETLERLVYYALDDAIDLEVELTDWTRLLVSDAEFSEVMQNEKAEKYD
ncbi:hypothetical protein F4X73_16255 [Candidatus Poribacteria bacterium]|nr:hypothetical protein [Candidatus Poribacteria bacterium]MYF55679.1 hypothetical protein [Candidatus Poribacteria bacterium]